MEVIPRTDERKQYGIQYIKCLANNRLYVGQTRENFYRRWVFHKWELKNNCHKNRHLQQAYNKYGEDSFEFGVLEKYNVNSKPCNVKELLSERERHWIKVFDSRNKGFNQTDGGEVIPDAMITPECRKMVGEKNRLRMLGSKLSDETKRRMSESHKGLVRTEEHRKHLSEALTGQHISAEHREKCRLANQGSKQKTAKYNEELIERLKIDYMNGLNGTELAKKYNMNRGTVYSIVNDRRWSHVRPNGWDEFIKNKK